EAVPAEILDVEGAKGRELQRQRLIPAAIGRQRTGFAHLAVDLEALRRSAAQGMAVQAQAAAAVVEAGLIDRDAFIAQRLIDFDGLLEALAGFMIRDLHVAGE